MEMGFPVRARRMEDVVHLMGIVGIKMIIVGHCTDVNRNGGFAVELEIGAVRH